MVTRSVSISAISVVVVLLLIDMDHARGPAATADEPPPVESPLPSDAITRSTQRGDGGANDPEYPLRQKDPLSDQRFEFQDDPYRPNVPPGVPQLTTPSQIWVRGDFRSVQVNVDSAGNNIVGDAANEPSIAVDPTDPRKIVIGWRQFDSIESNFRQAGWAYSHDWGQTWTFPGVLEPQVFRSDPILDSDSAGNTYYYSLSTLTSCEMFISRDSGLSWEGPIPAFGGDKAWMVVDKTGGPGDGNVYAQWNRVFSCCNGDYIRSTDGGQTYSVPTNVPTSPFWGTLSVGPDGALYVSGSGGMVIRSLTARDGSVATAFEQVSMANLGGATIAGFGPNPGGLLGQVWVATDHSTGPTRGHVYLLASVDPPGLDPLDIMFARSTDGGLTWSPPVRVNDDPVDNGAWQWFGTMSVAPNGRIDVVWNDTRAGGAVNMSELYYSFSTDGGETWTVNEPVTPPFDSFLGWPQQNKLGDYYHMVSNQTGANLAYAATFNGEQDVYFVRLNNDCNENGVPDIEDIEAGTSGDCNGNFLPDECEPDCNGNDTADECDIAAGGSADCNENRVPDECEPDEDCNGNGVQDICDIAAGPSQDCNQNAVPDECEADCNDNGSPDECDIAAGISIDCNKNGVPDPCDVASGGDCNNNNRPDDCDVAGFFAESPQLSPIGAGSSQLYTIPMPPEALGDVTFSFTAFGDLNSENTERIEVALNGSPIGSVFASGAHDCPVVPDVDELVVPAFFFNGLIDGDVAVDMIPAPGVAADRCVPGSYIQVRVTYEASMDCDGNGVPDECDPDCNGNAVPDACDIADQVSDDCQPNGVPDECEPDCDGNGIADDCDADGDGDGVIDACDPCPLDLFDDRDGDGLCDSDDGCPLDPDKTAPGQCGCGSLETDTDGDGVADCNDQCPGVEDAVFAPHCPGAIPTTSHWGLVVLSLLLLIAAKVYFNRRNTAAS